MVQVALMREMVEKHERILCEKYRSKFYDNIKVDLNEICCENEDCIYLACETLMNHWVP